MYHPPSQPDQYFFNTLDKALDVYSNFENVLLIGDFKAQIRGAHRDTFLNQHGLETSIKIQHIIRTQKVQVAQILFCPIDQIAFLKRTLFLQDCQIFIS